MPASDDSPQRAESRLAFLKRLPARTDRLARQWRHFCQHGWDINALALLVEDSRLLAEAARNAAPDLAQTLDDIAERLGQPLAQEALPDESATQWLLGRLADLAPDAADAAPQAAVAIGGELVESPRVELPPANLWRRWTSDATPAEPIEYPQPRVDEGVAAVAVDPLGLAVDDIEAALYQTLDPSALEVTELSLIDAVAELTPPAIEAVDPPAPAPTPATLPSAAPAPAVAADLPVAAAPVGGRIYHLSDASALSVELDQRLEVLGYELELLDDEEELKEILTALAPDLVLVDAGFIHELEGIGAVLRSTRERTGSRLLLLAICEEDTVEARLAARRAGADALLIAPRSVQEVIDKLQSLLTSTGDEIYRVMIVEDDRSQALFAESILRNAGMDVRVVLDAFEVMAALAEFHPDMVLMDLYMPGCDGAELTALIREREEHINLPIVFLSGESDVDKHYDALEAGGDDFLAKPIRPKHLIAAVGNRVRRARALQRRAPPAAPVAAAPTPRDSTTGLYYRTHVIALLGETLAAPDIAERRGGILFLDIDGLSALRDRLGLSGIERLLREAGAELVSRLDETDLAARYSDGCFVIVCPQRDDDALEAMAVRVREALVGRAFDIDGRPVRLRAALGVCPWRFGFADADTLIAAAERLSRDARASERGVRRYEPPRRSDISRDEAMLATLREAIKKDSFSLLYQPIVAVQGGDEAQFQTLVRLRGEDGRLVAAGQFVPLAESYDLIGEIDCWVLDKALDVIARRRDAGGALRLFVNQSPGTLSGEDHAAWLGGQLKAHGVPGSALVLEFALDAIEAHVELVQTFCRKLAPLGVRFCLSQYDGGETAELVLERLPVTYIKLARRHVVAGTDAVKSRETLQMLVERAHGKGLQVIAPLVEDAQVAAGLWVSGIDFIQGDLVQPAASDLSFDFQSAVL
ncbi:MAG: EAL domain-containing protein [Lysobacteraceae bacterium]